MPSVCPFRHSVDELIQVMKPWYDNYCFAINRYGQVTMYNSVMVLYFIDQYIHNNCDIPRDMIEDNIRVDYKSFVCSYATTRSLPMMPASSSIWLRMDSLRVT